MRVPAWIRGQAGQTTSVIAIALTCLILLARNGLEIRRQNARLRSDDAAILRGLTALHDQQCRQISAASQLFTLLGSEGSEGWRAAQSLLAEFRHQQEDVAEAIHQVRHAYLRRGDRWPEYHRFEPALFALESANERLDTDVRTLMRIAREDRLHEFANVQQAFRESAQEVQRQLTALDDIGHASLAAASRTIDHKLWRSAYTSFAGLALLAGVGVYLLQYGGTPRSNAQQAAPASPGAKTCGGTHLGGTRILVAEDEPRTQRILRLLLRSGHATVEVCDNGEDAVRIALNAQSRGEPYDVILMDIQMPTLDGCAATRKLRDRDCRQPIVALSGVDTEKTREEAAAAGCDDFLAKPIARPQLQSLIARLTQHKDAGKATSGAK